MKLARLFVFIGGLLVLLLTAALVAPYFIDWTNYRSDFERQAGIILGREVRVEGAARARLLPFPSVTFTDVVVAGASPDEPSMTVEEFSMDAELAPFLRGELLIFDMRLVRPQVHIFVDGDGRVDWTMRPSTPFELRQISLERVAITDGTVTIHRAGGLRSIVVNDINSEVSARSLAGPWRMQGSLSVDGIPMSVSGSTGTMAQDGIRVRLALQPQSLPFTVDLDGHVQGEGGVLTYAGSFDLRTPAAGQGDTQPSTVPSNRVTGRFHLDHQRLMVEEFRLIAGSPEDPYTTEGRAEISFGADPSFSIVADGAQLRWDGAADEHGGSGMSAAERIEAVVRFVSGLPRPTIPGIVSVNIPAIVAGDTTIRDVRIEARPVAEGWNLGSVAATLPGRTRLEGSGVLALGDQAAFSGHFLLAIAQPSGFAAWVARDIDDAIRRLPAAGFSADVHLSGTRQVFENLELVLGDATFAGRVERQSPADRRASVLVSLEGGRLDLDGLRAFASLFVDDQGENRLSNHDVDVELAAGPVVWRGVETERFETKVRLRDQALEIDRFSAMGLADANISATGRLENLAADPAGSIDATIVAVDLAPLVETLAAVLPDVQPLRALARNASAYPGLLEDAKVDVLASRAVNGSTEFTLRGMAGGTDFSITGSAASLITAPDTPVELRLTARNDDAAVLYARAGLPALPLGLAGEASIEASVSGPLGDGAAAELAIKGTGLSATFDGTLTRSESGFNSRGQFAIKTEDLEPWLSVAGILLPGFGYGLPVDVSASIDVGDKLAVISDLAGTVADADIYGDLNAEMRNGIPHIIGSVHLSRFDLGLPVEMVTGSAALQPAEEGRWPEASLQREISTPFSADVELAAEELWFGGWASARAASMQLRLDREKLSVASLSAEMLGGVVKGSAELRNDAGTGLLSSQFSLADVSLEKLLPESGLAGSADLSASLTASGKSVNALVAALSGSGSADVRNLAVSGLNPSAFPDLLARADELGAQVDAGQVAAFAPDIVRNGVFRTGSVAIAFTVANGVARFPQLHLEGEGARVSVDGAADLRQRTVAASGSITYHPGLEGVSGAEPAVRFSVEGPLGEVQVSLDTEPLAQFLTQRALEREQERVEHMQAVLLETQRLRREVRYYEQQAANRAAEEAERIRAEREAERSRKAAEEARRQREEAERRAAEERRRQEMERRLQEDRQRREDARQPQPQSQQPQPQRPQPQPPQQQQQRPASSGARPSGTPMQQLPGVNVNPATGQRSLTSEENERRLRDLFNRR